MEIKSQHAIRTLRLKMKAEGYAWLNAAAIEVNAANVVVVVHTPK